MLIYTVYIYVFDLHINYYLPTLHSEQKRGQTALAWLMSLHIPKTEFIWAQSIEGSSLHSVAVKSQFKTHLSDFRIIHLKFKRIQQMRNH